MNCLSEQSSIKIFSKCRETEYNLHMFRVMSDSTVGNALKVILGRIESAVQRRPLVSLGEGGGGGH